MSTPLPLLRPGQTLDGRVVVVVEVGSLIRRADGEVDERHEGDGDEGVEEDAPLVEGLGLGLGLGLGFLPTATCSNPPPESPAEPFPFTRRRRNGAQPWRPYRPLWCLKDASEVPPHSLSLTSH